MAPLSKVSLIDVDIPNEKESGPHSILFGITNNTNNSYNKSPSSAVISNNKDSQSIVREKTKKRQCSTESDANNKIFHRSNTFDSGNYENTSSSENFKSSTFCTNPFLNDYSESNSNKNNFPDIVNSTRILSSASNSEETFVVNIKQAEDTFVAFSSNLNNQNSSLISSANENNPFLKYVKQNEIDNATIIYSKEDIAKLNLPLGSRRGTYHIQYDEAQVIKSIIESNSSSSENTLESENLSNESVKKLNFTFTNPCCPATSVKDTTENEFHSSPVHSRPTAFSHSTPVKDSESEVESSPRRRCRRTVTNATFAIEEEGNKRDSLELDESLGILTPDQMADFSGFIESKCSSLDSKEVTSQTQNISKNSSLGVHDLNTTLKGEENDTLKLPREESEAKCCTVALAPDIKTEFSEYPVCLNNSKNNTHCEIPSPNADQSINDVSLGIIDIQSLSAISGKSDTTVNIDLPLDSLGNEQKPYTTIRFEQTPSPEDLPLDPTPILDSEPKTEPSQSKTTSNFVMSITSITSLDTGYQGDGEMSRPASRGADHSPLSKRPLPRLQTRRVDPMTDSDFYTESDADNHEEHNLRGDRRAQVIDGTLYGVDAQAAADIYANNRENMDSSGIFTDIEANKVDDSSAAESAPQIIRTDVSPTMSDSSSKSISGNSQNNAHILLSKNNKPAELRLEEKSSVETKNAVNRSMETVAKRKSNTSVSSVASSPTNIRSPKHVLRNETTPKSFKMPKRNVTSKVKAMLETESPRNHTNVKKIEPKKPVNRWDAVMSKISKNQSEVPKVNMKDVKPKVFSSFNKENVLQNNNQKAPNNKLRRTRSRVTENSSSPKLKKMGSIHSSASDLSNTPSVNKAPGSAKKREVTRVTQVLSASKISPRSPHKNTSSEIKRTSNYINNEAKPAAKRAILSSKDKKQSNMPSKDCGKATVKGGRTSPGVRPPVQSRAPLTSAPKTAEALAVLVQHLVFTLDAFRTPSLKKQVERSRLEVEEMRIAYRHLEEQLSENNRNHALKIEEEKLKFRADIAELLEQHRNNIAQTHQQHAKLREHLDLEHNNIRQQLIKSHEEQLHKLRTEFNKLQKAHEQTVEILREENDSTREEIDEKNAIIEKLQKYKTESERWRKEYEAREQTYKDDIKKAHEEITRLKEEHVTLMNYSSDGKDNKFHAVLAEVESLRAVLELKQSEMGELRKALVEANQKAELLPSLEEKVSALTARCEDLQHQLDVKCIQEQQLICENKKLHESFREEINHNKRLSQYNEELQWKLQQNKEVVSRVLEQAEETALNRSFLTASFNERHHQSIKPQLERALSFKERSVSKNSLASSCSTISRKSKNSLELDINDMSPPNSPKVKGVVEKSDSVSYVLEMEESPEMIANRIVRRSFRNPTPPKSTPTKSPANKRPRIKNPLSMSASTSAIGPSSPKDNHCRSRNGEDTGSSHSDEVFVWNNPACSTPNGKYSELQPLSVGYSEIMRLSESNSEDESTASSSSSGHF